MQLLKSYFMIFIILMMFVPNLSAGDKMNKFPAKDFFNPQVAKLLETIQKGDKSTAQKLISNGLSLDTIGEQNITPLFWFLINEDKKAAQLALNLGANPNFPDGLGRTPVNYFASSIFTDWLEMILAAGGNPNEIADGEPVLFKAIGTKKAMENLKALISYGADINLKDKEGRNSVLYAAMIDEFGEALYLAEQGANIDVKSNSIGNLVDMINDAIVEAREEDREIPQNVLNLKNFMEQHGVKFPPAKRRGPKIEYRIFTPDGVKTTKEDFKKMFK